MTNRLRKSLANLFFLLEESNLRDPLCACHRPIPKAITPEIRKALDDAYDSVNNEPGPSRTELLEIDK